MVKTGCLIVCLFACLIAGAQDFSNKGKDFWITFPAHVDGTTAVMGIYITSDAAASGQVQVGAISIPFSITPNTVKRIFLGPGGDAPNSSVYLNQSDGVATGAGIHVTSDAAVVVYAHIIKQARSGASLVLPTPVWGKEYLVPSHGSAGQSGANSGIPMITVVAKEANTVVEITPKAESLNTGRQPDVPYTITLDQPGDVYQVQFEKDADISGSRVRSIASATSGCKPIGVFSASTWSAFDCLGASGGDNLFQQLFPTRSFGKSFVTAPFIHRNYDIIRVFVTDPSTVVTRTENGATSVLSGLQANSFYEFKTSWPNKIDADKPISVVQYITSQSCYTNNTHADPEMVLLNSTDQTLDNITVFSAHQNFVPTGQSNVAECFLNIIIKTIAAPTFRINGAPPSAGFQAIPGTAFSYLQENVTVISATNPVQTLSADSGFAAIAYGYGNVESYGYNAGCNVRDLYQYITIKNDNATVNFPATCVNTPFQFGIVLPYAATHLKWLFYGKFTDEDIASPVADSTFMLDGKTLNRYRLPKSYNYPAIGTYKVSVIATNATSDGCNGEQQIDYDVQVFEKPKAKFSWQHSGCLADSVRFADSTDGLGRIVNRWLWQFGDNTTSILKDPTKKYAQAGSYTIKESIITDVGCLADTSATIQISTPPIAGFDIIPPFCGGKIKLTDKSTIVSGTIVKRYWDFGNGKKDTTTTNDPVFATYASAGTYKITLIAESNSGCRSQLIEHDVTITPGPVADFTPPSAICLPGAPASFKNLSTISDGTTAQLKYEWDFGDGGTSTAIDPSHSYAIGGPITVTLTVTSAGGCVKDTSKILNNIYAQPKAEFDLPSTACLHDISNFKDQSTAANQSLVQYFWNFGDNSTSTDKDPAKSYAAAAPYQVKHWAISDKGCPSDTIEKTYTINPPPTAAFTLDASACKDKEVTFTSQSVSNGGSLVRWYWNLGDGTIQDESSDNSFGHIYTATGSQNVSLAVTTDKGCKSDTLRKTIQVNLLPLPDFSLPEVCLSDAFAEFSDNSTIDDGTESQFTYQWDFGDANADASNPNTSTQKTPRHRYSAAGNFNVTLEVSSKDGCTASVVKSLTVNGSKPKADFTIADPNNLCSNSIVEITDASSVDFGNITKTEIYWEWPSTTENTIDDDPVPGKIYQHTYTDFQSPATRTFTIHYLAYSGGVCVNEISKDVVINARPQVLFQQIPGICADAASRLITQASNLGGLAGNGEYSGSNVSANGLFDPAAGEGTYTINYLFVSNAGCRDSASQEITVWKKPIADFTADAPACIGKPVTFTDNSNPIVGKVIQWNWILGDGTTDNRTNGSPFQKSYSTGGSVDVQLQVSTDSGCVSSITTKPITINPLPVVDFDLPPVVCLPAGKAQFTDRSTIADGSESQFIYLWTSGVGNTSSTLKDPVFNYTATGAYNVKLQVTSKNGCVNSSFKTLSNITPQPMANYDFSPAAVCLGEPIDFTDKSNPLSETVIAWNWNFDDGTQANQQNVTHRYTQSGIFDVTFFYTTQKGCYSDTVTKQVLVRRIPTVNAGPDLAVLEGGQVVLRAKVTGSTNYQYEWSPSTWLSSTSILQPVSSPHDDITYILTVTGEGGCTAWDNVFVKLLLTPVIPNAFSPNGDGINDVWNIKNLESYTDCNINVFDRYGRVVYNSIGYNKPWDGTSHGVLLPVGVYYYIIEPKNGKGPVTGSVTILH